MTEVPPANEPTPAEEAGSAGNAPDLDRLHPAAVTLWRLGYGIQGAVTVALLLAGDALLDLPVNGGILAGAIGLVAIVLVMAVPAARHRAWGYRLRESDLYIRHGVLVRTTTIVPHARIQHVDTRRGLLDRVLGLADVVVYTAGTRGAVIPIPALGAATAETLRDRLVALSGAGDAV